MPAYQAPLDVMSFMLNDVFNAADTFAAIPAFADCSADVVEAVLAEAAKFCQNELTPINRQGDENGCGFDAGKVTTAPGTAQAWGTFVEGGWPGLSLPAEFGGQNLPKTVQFLVDEMIASTNMAFGLFPGLTRGAVEAIVAHASDELKARWLPAMVEGRWTGAMGLTEPQAGTDLGLLRTKAEPAGDGSYKITGTKIFISAGEHDLAENIVHLVLARLPGAPEGTRGISLFLVPKRLLDDAGNPVTANALSCGSIEHKMGIKASPTCVMNFDGATGWLVGQPHKGLAAMFTMMNSERLFVGLQGIGIAEAAYQGAAAYAKERVQGRDAATGKAGVILGHADVRRNLLTARVNAWGMRALALWTALHLDQAEHHPDPAARARAEAVVALVTPVIKAAGSDLGLESAVAGQQVFGGHGYIREWGMEQLVRDGRIAQIYEGTNGVQAMDLVGRKLSMAGGALIKDFCALVQTFLDQSADDSALAGLCQGLDTALAGLRRAAATLAAASADAQGAGATDFLRLFAVVGQGWMWGRMVKAAAARPAGDPITQVVPALAEFFTRRILIQAQALEAGATSGGAAEMALAADLF